jgi:phage tail-like protein
MDVQGSQYHLLADTGDWGRCTDTTPGPSAGRTLADLWADLAAHGSAATNTSWEYDACQRVLRLTRETPLFRRAGRNDPLDLATRRGAGRDGYGNWFWISADRRGLCWLPVGQRQSVAWWSVDDLAASCTCGAGTTGSTAGGFAGTCTCLPSDLVLQGLCVTTHHYLLAGYLAPAGSGLLVFDLQAGGEPLRMPWPSDLPFTPWDLADTADGGALVLDRDHGTWWRLDEHLRLRGTQPETPIGFGPVGGGDPVLLTGPARPTPYVLTDAGGAPVHPIGIEPGPGGSTLVLDADATRGWSTLSCYDGEVLRWQTPLQDVVEVVDPADPDGVAFRYSLLAHDFAYAEDGGPLDPPCLYLADAEGNQVVAFTLDPATGEVLARDDYLPLREWAARALVRAGGGVHYDFDVTSATTGSTRWVPLAVFGECRFATTATLTTATDFGAGLPGLIGDTFDAVLPGTVWHRLLLDAHVPTGTAITLRARASDDPALLTLEEWIAQPTPYLRGDGPELPWADPWADRRGDVRDPQPLPAGMGTHELLLQQVSGRYLQLELTLVGNGRATPLVRALRAWYPRFSYPEHYLPAVYVENDAPDRFLERFLANFEGLYTALEERIEHTHLILDARTALAADLPWLAAWFGLALDPLWDEERRRFLIRHVDRFYRIRGTVRGLVATLKVYLDTTVDEGVFCGGGAGGVRIVERFLTRDTGGAAYGAPPSQPDPDPLTRVRRSAHRFDVLVPADLSEADTAMVQRIVETAKPAHTAFALRRYHELFVVGQARLGLDTELGTAPVFVPMVPGDADAGLLAATYLGYPRPFDLTDRVVSDRDRVGTLPVL